VEFTDAVNSVLRTLLTAAALVLAATPSRALTDTETRWLHAATPVLAYAEQAKLPVDVVVQPQNAPGKAPLAMAFVEGRCKLVLSMRGNPQAEAALAGVAAPLQPLVIEAIAAHELAHCWRHLQGAWHALPAGFSEEGDEPADAQQARALREMRETRREEGFADLVGLAWTLRHHPAQYADVQAWLEKTRSDEPAYTHHDTRAWVRLARQPSALPNAVSPFEQVRTLWEEGLLAE
jgi:hypothetical protein